MHRVFVALLLVAPSLSQGFEKVPTPAATNERMVTGEEEHSETKDSTPHQPGSHNTGHCSRAQAWCLEAGIRAYLSSDPISKTRTAELTSLFGPYAASEFRAGKPDAGPAVGIYGVRKLPWLPELKLRLGAEFVRYATTGLTDGRIDGDWDGANGFGKVTVSGISFPATLEKSFTSLTFGNGRWRPGISAGASVTFVTNVKGEFTAPDEDNFFLDYSQELEKKHFATLGTSLLLDWMPSSNLGTFVFELGYEKGLGPAYSLPKDIPGGSRYRGFESTEFDLVSLNLRYRFD